MIIYIKNYWKKLTKENCKEISLEERRKDNIYKLQGRNVECL